MKVLQIAEGKLYNFLNKMVEKPEKYSDYAKKKLFLKISPRIIYNEYAMVAPESKWQGVYWHQLMWYCGQIFEEEKRELTFPALIEKVYKLQMIDYETKYQLYLQRKSEYEKSIELISKGWKSIKMKTPIPYKKPVRATIRYNLVILSPAFFTVIPQIKQIFFGTVTYKKFIRVLYFNPHGWEIYEEMKKHGGFEYIYGWGETQE